MERHTRHIEFDVSAEAIVIAEAHSGCERARDLGSIPYSLESVAQSVPRKSGG